MPIIVILGIKMAIKCVSIKPCDKKLEVAELDDVGIKIFLKPFLWSVNFKNMQSWDIYLPFLDLTWCRIGI